MLWQVASYLLGGAAVVTGMAFAVRHLLLTRRARDGEEVYAVMSAFAVMGAFAVLHVAVVTAAIHHLWPLLPALAIAVACALVIPTAAACKWHAKSCGIASPPNNNGGARG